MDKTWTHSLIDERKKSVAEELKPLRNEGGEAKVLEYVTKRLPELSMMSGDDRLTMYLLSMHGLIAHRDSNFLSEGQFNRLTGICLATLKHQDIRPDSSKLAYLFSDTYAILGQISARHGQHWQGAWHQLFGKRFLKDADADAKLFHDVTTAQRLFRNGILDQAKAALSSILSPEVGLSTQSPLWATAVSNYVSLLRLQGDFEAAETVTKVILKLKDVPARMTIELEWERLCRKVTTKRSTTDMAAACRTTHQKPTYILELCLWDIATGDAAFAKRNLALAKVTKNKIKQYQEFGALFPIASAIQNSFDTDTSLDTRIESLGNALSEARSVRSIDLEMLIWLAASKALRRSKAGAFADICEAEYRALSIKVSAGSRDDVLSLMDAKETKKSQPPEQVVAADLFRAVG